MANEEINSGLLVMGLSNTVFFGQGAVHELVLVNLATGNDFSLQVSEEQAAFLVDHLNNDFEQSGNALKSEAADVEKNAWSETEATPQL